MKHNSKSSKIIGNLKNQENKADKLESTTSYFTDEEEGICYRDMNDYYADASNRNICE